MVVLIRWLGGWSIAMLFRSFLLGGGSDPRQVYAYVHHVLWCGVFLFFFFRR